MNSNNWKINDLNLPNNEVLLNARFIKDFYKKTTNNGAVKYSSTLQFKQQNNKPAVINCVITEQKLISSIEANNIEKYEDYFIEGKLIVVYWENKKYLKIAIKEITPILRLNNVEKTKLMNIVVLHTKGHKEIVKRYKEIIKKPQKHWTPDDIYYIDNGDKISEKMFALMSKKEQEKIKAETNEILKASLEDPEIDNKVLMIGKFLTNYVVQDIKKGQKRLKTKFQWFENEKPKGEINCIISDPDLIESFLDQPPRYSTAFIIAQLLFIEYENKIYKRLLINDICFENQLIESEEEKKIKELNVMKSFGEEMLDLLKTPTDKQISKNNLEKSKKKTEQE